MATDPRSTRAWRKLRDQVVIEEPDCRLRLPECTGRSVTADHILPVKTHPHLALERSNCRGACDSCNRIRGQVPEESLVLGTRAANQPRILSIFRPVE